MRNKLQEELDKRILLLDGAIGTEIQKYDLSEKDYGGKEGCNEYLVIRRPDVIKEIYSSYFAAGSDIVETNTFGGNRVKLSEYGLGDKVYEINKEASKLAREAADECEEREGRECFVLGAIGPTGYLPSSPDPELGDIDFDELVEIFEEQVKGLQAGGVSGLLIETTQDILELKAIVHGIQKSYKEGHEKLPIVAQITLDTNGKMLLGTDISSALTTIENLRVDVIGINCSTGPKHMRVPIQYLCENTRLKVSCLPNAGLPINEGGRAVYKLGPEEMKEELKDFVEEFGIDIVGGCCGTTPEHIKELRGYDLGIKKERVVEASGRRVSSALKSVSLSQEPRPLIIGERLNSQGSRRVKELLLREDYDGLLKIAEEQMGYGAHILDICVALTERSDEAQMMDRLVKRLSFVIESPLMFDSTDAEVIERALKSYPGSPIINSINLESGEDIKYVKMQELSRDYGASLVALTIDEAGMAVTKERKLEIAKRLYKSCLNKGIEGEGLLLDVLTFTLATGEAEWEDSAHETLKGIGLVKKEFPEVKTVLGLSNVSFGLKLKARKVLNSVFLYHALNEGLDAVIINPQHVIRYPDIEKKERELTEALIFNKHKGALLELIEHFEKSETEVQGVGVGVKVEKKRVSVEELLFTNIVKRDGEGIESLIDEALDRHSPIHILNEILLPAMKEVGNLFGRGELILPFVLQSAEVMKKAVSYLENFLEKDESSQKGRMLLATVYGDVHDIGKNLVKTILTNNGYKVYDLGKQVAVSTIIDNAVKYKVDAIGLSALLVSTSKQMGLCVKELAKRGYEYPVIIGGAAINKNYSMQISYIGEAGGVGGGEGKGNGDGGGDGSVREKDLYRGGVLYAKDAFEGLDLMDKLTCESSKEELLKEQNEEVFNFRKQARVEKGFEKREEALGLERRSEVQASENIPKAPFWGHKVLQAADIDIDKLFSLLSLSELYRLSWGGRGLSKEAYKELVENEFNAVLNGLKEEGIRGGYFEPVIIYGYYRCVTSKEKLLLYKGGEGQEVLEGFSFPRQKTKPYLSITDYFAKEESGIEDVIIFQVVSLGNRLTEINDRLNENGEYQKAYYLHGLGVQLAEALTEYSHRRVLDELGLDAGQGKRYSFGYPACPNLEDQKKLMAIMPVRDEIEVSLTEAYLLVPEQSTTSFIIHHKNASYFRV